MNLFGTSVEKLQKKSAGILSVFTRTVDELVATNDQINVEKQKQVTKIQKAQAAVVDLDTQHAENTKVINKIQEFFK